LKKQLKYAFQDIWRYKLRNFNLFIQTLAVLLLISLLLFFSLSINSYKNKLNEIMQDQEEEIYISHDITSDRKFEELTYAPDSIDRQSELYKFMKENPSFKTYTADMQWPMYLPDANIDSSFTNPYDPGNPDYYFLLKIDNEFQNVFKLRCVKGRIFSDEDFKDAGDEIPILLGYDFQKYYDVDDVITDYRNQRYKVIGFLEKSSFYINPLRGNQIYWLDEVFVEPLQPYRFEEQDYYSAIASTFIITSNPENLQAIQEKTNELRLHAFSFESFTEILEEELEIYQYIILVIGIITAVILFFAIAGFILNLIQFIKNHKEEFEKHLLSGGGIGSIVTRIVIQVLFVILLANIVVAVMYMLLSRSAAPPIFYNVTPGYIIALTILASLVIGLIIIVYPVIMLYRMKKSSILKSNS